MYADVVCIYIELQFRKFKERDTQDDNNSFRIFQITPTKSIDLKNMIELDTNTPLIERKIRRCENLADRTRHCSDERHSLCEKFIFKNKDGYF